MIYVYTESLEVDTHLIVVCQGRNRSEVLHTVVMYIRILVALKCDSNAA